jgi:lambda family phage tail tape measure protein
MDSPPGGNTRRAFLLELSMTDEIGRGVVSFEADASGLKAEMNTTADAVENLGATLQQAGTDGAAALDGISVSATEMSSTASGAVTRFLESLNRQTIAIEGGKMALLEYKAAQLDATAEAQQYFDRMNAVAAQTQAAAAAQQQLNEMMTQAAADNAFLNSLKEQADTYGLTKTQMLAYQAAQRGLETEAVTLISRLTEQEAQTKATAAAQEALTAAMTSAAADNAFLNSLKEQADTYGLTKTQMLQYQAAQRGLETEASTLIERMAAQEAQTKATSAAQAEFNETMSAASADNAFLTSLNARANAIGKSTADLLAEQAAERGLSTEAAAAIATLKAHEQATEGAGESAEGMGLKTAGARKEIAVLIHELATGNVKNFGGSLLVLGERLDVLESLMSPVALGAAAVVGAIGAFAIAMLKGENQLDTFNKSMQATSGYAGVTAAQVGLMADQMTALGVPVTTANTLLSAVVATGKVSGQAIQSVATASALLATATGQDATQIIDQFAAMSDNVADGAAKMSDQYHFLTLAEYDEIKALQEHGDTAGAMKVAADALTSSLEAQKQPLGTLPAILHEAANAWSAFWQAAMNAGKPESPADKVNELRAAVAAQTELLSISPSAANYQAGAPAGGPTNSGANYRGEVQPTNASGQALLASLKAQLSDASHDADQHSNSSAVASWLTQLKQQALDAGIAVDKLSQSFDKNYEKQKALKDLNDQYKQLFSNPDDPTHQDPRLKGVTQSADGSFSGGRYSSLVSGINQKYKPQSTAAVDNAGIAAQVKQAQQQIADLNASYANSTTVLKQQHDAGLIDDDDYYGAVQDHIDKYMAAQLAQIDLEQKGLEQSNVTGAARIKLNQQLKDLETQRYELYGKWATLQFTTDAEQTKADNNRQDVLTKYVATLNEALDTQKQSIANQVASVGAGSQDFSRQQNLTQLSSRFDNQNLKLAASKTSTMTPDQTALIDQEIAANNAARDATVKAWQQGYADIDAAQSDWRNGATKAFADYGVAASNIATETATTFQDAFKGLEDALVSFVTTGKLSFTSLATSVISDIARVEIRAAESQVFGYIQSLISPGLGGASGSENIGATATSTPDDLVAGFGHATGGFITGPGSGTSDSISARLSNGEYVLTAAAVRAIGVGNLDQMNSGAKVSRFATGGFVGPSSVVPSGGASSSPQINLNVDASGGSQGGASFGPSDAKWLQTNVQKLVDARMRQKMAGQGGFAYQLRNGQIA